MLYLYGNIAAAQINSSNWNLCANASAFSPIVFLLYRSSLRKFLAHVRNMINGRWSVWLQHGQNNPFTTSLILCLWRTISIATCNCWSHVYIHKINHQPFLCVWSLSAKSQSVNINIEHDAPLKLLQITFNSLSRINESNKQTNKLGKKGCTNVKCINCLMTFCMNNKKHRYLQVLSTQQNWLKFE